MSVASAVVWGAVKALSWHIPVHINWAGWAQPALGWLWSALQDCCVVTSFFSVFRERPHAWKSAENYHLLKEWGWLFLQQCLREVWQSSASDTAGLVSGCGFCPIVCLNTNRDSSGSVAISENRPAVWEVQFCLVASQRNSVFFVNKLLCRGFTEAACSCFHRLAALF